MLDPKSAALARLREDFAEAIVRESEKEILAHISSLATTEEMLDACEYAADVLAGYAERITGGLVDEYIQLVADEQMESFKNDGKRG